MADTPEPISHWHHRVEAFNTSALEFYASIKAELDSMQVPVTFSEVEWSEGGVLSAKRKYLRIEFNRFVFDICAAPFGTSFFFSWWLGKRSGNPLLGCFAILAVPVVFLIALAMAGFVKGSLIAIVVLTGALFLVRQGIPEVGEGLASLPYVGPIIGRIANPVTYYSIDTRIMFEETVHETTVKLVEGLLAAKGAKALSAEERKPKHGGMLR